MGKITIEGRAEREVLYNAVELTICFYKRAKTSAEALSSVEAQTEKFLSILVDEGVQLKDIHIGDNNIQQTYRDEDNNVQVKKEINIRMLFNMAFINHITNIIRQQDFEIIFDCDYQLTNMHELQIELLKEAIADSKEKAEFIASVMNQKIIGIDNVEHIHADDIYYIEEREMPYYGGLPVDKLLSDKLEAPITTISEKINVVWLME